MQNFTYPELMVHIPLCTHKLPQSILIISDNDSMIQGELARHSNVSATTTSVDSALDAVRNMDDNSFDVVLCEADTDEVLLAHLNRVSKDDALMSMTHPTLDDVEANKKLLGQLGKYFKVIMPYTVHGDETLLLASKEYHPTADIILQRSDLLEGQSHYNCDVHTAVFAMPNYIRKAYLGSIRN